LLEVWRPKIDVFVRSSANMHKHTKIGYIERRIANGKDKK
jgi:hypothetical protein